MQGTPPPPTNILPPMQIAFTLPCEINEDERPLMQDMVLLIALMLKNGANAFELQQRLMGLG